MNLMEDLIRSKLYRSSSPGGPIDADTIITATSDATEEQQAQIRENIGAASIEDLGTVFTLKGSQPTYQDLLLVQDPKVGDVWYVESVSAGYIWMTSTAEPNGYWEELGETIDLSAYQLKPTIVTDTTSTSKSLTPDDNTVYNFGSLTSLTITHVSGRNYTIVFNSPSNIATTLTVPASLRMPVGFSLMPKVTYELNVYGDRVAVGAWGA